MFNGNPILGKSEGYMRKLTILITAILVCGAIPAISAQRVTTMKVSGERVNVRARPSLNAEVVGQLSDGQTVSVKSIQNEWVEIVMPTTMDLWAHKDFVRMGTVQTKKLNVRAGPGINYNVVGVLQRGDQVIPRGEFGEWIKIAPPEAASVWIHQDYIERAQRVDKKRAARRKRTVEPSVVRRPVPVAVPAHTRASQTQPRVVVAAVDGGAESQLPADWKLVPLEGQGKQVEREGILRQVGFLFGRPTRFRLVRDDGNNTLVTICYVRGNRKQLDDWVGERLMLRGREYWIRESEYPVLIVEQMIPRLRTLPR